MEAKLSLPDQVNKQDQILQCVKALLLGKELPTRPKVTESLVVDTLRK